MAWAHARNYAVFTHDLDFGTMLTLTQAEGPSVLQVRCFNVLPEAIGSLVLNLLDNYSDALQQGALIVADEQGKRVRILPLEPRKPSRR